MMTPLERLGHYKGGSLSMRLNADFSRAAVVVPDEDAWVRSPESGVERFMLDRIGDEVARATSIVRYVPGSRFARHVHEKGEEFLVLDGVFSDESGDFPSGSYVRNPPGTGHSPYSEDGCRILVKLRQFDPADTVQVFVDTRQSAAGWQQARDGYSQQLPLHDFGTEQVKMLRTPRGQPLPIKSNAGGVELLIVAGSLEYLGNVLPTESWLRFAADDDVKLRAASDTTLWMKSGHLPSGPG